MPRYCAVPGCKNTQDGNVILHRFPLKNQQLLEKWENFVNKFDAQGKKWTASSFSCICNKHFLNNDYMYMYPGDHINTRSCRLSSNAVPSRSLVQLIKIHQYPCAVNQDPKERPGLKVDSRPDNPTSPSTVAPVNTPTVPVVLKPDQGPTECQELNVDSLPDNFPTSPRTISSAVPAAAIFIHDHTSYCLKGDSRPDNVATPPSKVSPVNPPNVLVALTPDQDPTECHGLKRILPNPFPTTSIKMVMLYDNANPPHTQAVKRVRNRHADTTVIDQLVKKNKEMKLKIRTLQQKLRRRNSKMKTMKKMISNMKSSMPIKTYDGKLKC